MPSEVRPAGLSPMSCGHRPWHPKIWYGMGLVVWLQLLWRHRFAIDACRVPVTITATLLSLRNSAAAAIQSAVLRLRSADDIAEPPLFVIGHWRCGTTWLHELLAQDDRHTYPTTFECLAPTNFLVSEFMVTWLFSRLFAPLRRPMDSMPVEWRSPQEDELALMIMGQPSPYERFAFPNGPFPDRPGLTLELRPDEAERWKTALRRFLTVVSHRRPKRRLILKSPAHMGRVRMLLEMFPDARFVHVIRDPYVVFPSSVHMWRSMSEAHGLQQPTCEGLNEFVLEAFLALHDSFAEARAVIGPRRLVEVRYEDLVRDPIAVLREIYDRLELGSLDPALPQIQQRLASSTDYKVNSYALAPALQDDITRRWGAIIRRQQYAVRPLSSQAHARRSANGVSHAIRPPASV